MANRSGTGNSDDPTLEPGNYSDSSIFGGPLPSGTGAPGSAGNPARGDNTTEPGQLDDGLTGLSRQDIDETGAPGTATSPASGGGTTVSYTSPGSWEAGNWTTETADDALSGPQDSTQANGEGYATGGPQLPGIKGNEPQAGGPRFQPGAGSVMRGGRAVR